jgi:hypothetical protein
VVCWHSRTEVYFWRSFPNVYKCSTCATARDSEPALRSTSNFKCLTERAAARAGSHVHPLALRAEQAEQFNALTAGAIEPVREARVELGCLAGRGSGRARPGQGAIGPLRT